MPETHSHSKDTAIITAWVPLLTPQGRLHWTPDAETPLTVEVCERLSAAFTADAGHGLLWLGARGVGLALPPALAWWRDFAGRYVTALCATPENGDIDIPPPDAAMLNLLIDDAPPFPGDEYLTPAILAALWGEIGAALKGELAAAPGLQDFLRAHHPAWNQVGRVHFNLAENRQDEDAPFAFLATYTPRLSAHGKAQHLPLSRALTEFSGKGQKTQLLSLLLPVQRAAGQCPWLRQLVDEGDIYYPLRWLPDEALRFLRDVPQLEAAGIVVRLPGVWRAGRPSRPKIGGSIGGKPPSLLGMDALLDFRLEVTLDGERLDAAEIEAMMQGADGLRLIRGRWVEVDRRKLGRLLERFTAVEQAAAAGGLPFAEAMRLMAGVSLDAAEESDDAQWSGIAAGPWLAETLCALRQPEGLAQVDPGADLRANLRPYQHNGLRWLYLLTRLGLGACLADDMGLGKTIQVLALLLVLKQESARAPAATPHPPSLLIAPASLLANWAAEAERFAPGLRCLVAHPSALPGDTLRALDAGRLAGVDLLITSYGTLLRLPRFTELRWRLAIIDEAQAIKNPGAKQTRQVKKLNAAARIALTGTPVENRLADLWSIFDFTHPGLLGSPKVFASFVKRLGEREHFGPLRALVRPYILRRLKTDKQVIADLPDKTEMKAWCHLSAKQIALYREAVEALAATLADAEGIGRKGAVLSSLLRLKQVCNHPSQWLGDAAWEEGDSGKFARLREIAETIAAKQEKALVFTQFREATEPLAAFLGSIFGRPGLILHGGTPVARRRELVKRFQEDELTPFFVLSLKAGGAGLNLTAAAHVIHFDRWWNPAVENQATDRAFRIGQRRNVLVHKFVCRGTVEERIDRLIEAKQSLAQDVLEESAEVQFTEMSDRELLDLVRLDIHAAHEA